MEKEKIQSVSDYKQELRNIFENNKNTVAPSERAENIKKTVEPISARKWKFPPYSPEANLQKKQKKEVQQMQSEVQYALTLRVQLTHKDLWEISKDFDNTLVSSENIKNVNEKVSELLKDNPEGIWQNFDVNVGDRFIYDKNRKIMSIMRWENIMFQIRFTPFTPQETKEKSEIPKNNNLWEWLRKHGAWPGQRNSCGASCGELLNKFWFRSILPQSGRDGKNWDTILETHASKYFKKIPVNHPDSAPAGSILVFNENATKGSVARKKHGHVEIKGSDGMYYSYYKSMNAGGSSRTSEKNPEKYKKLTGFTGYAYVYNGEAPPDKKKS